ncbi:RusA family crossover junction endodeoxyribonuclease [Clostridium guangxiense]|uniref:hypothetical protein n=1 Tax=Clostridium guangxiense TaxID=1662055 RepID=UPI001E634B66|nr:hypothetical protein [Clostridium guangxiense]MCD2345094.1 hypothetical protein [Clostridium guangxiense]
MHEDRLMYQDTTFAKTRKNEEIIHTIKCFEDLRMNLYKIAEERIEVLKLLPETYDLAEKMQKELEIKYEIECSKERIKLTIFDFLPIIYIKTTNKGAGYFVEKWKTTISNALRSLNLKSVNEVFVWIKMFIPVKSRTCDLDNKYFKPVFDGIYRSGLVQDDCIKYIRSFGFEIEKNDENPRTEIYIYLDDMKKRVSELMK